MKATIKELIDDANILDIYDHFQEIDRRRLMEESEEEEEEDESEQAIR